MPLKRAESIGVDEIQMSEIKPIAGLAREKLRDVIPLQTPYSIYFFPTNLCNFRCCYCAHAQGAGVFEERYGLKPESMSLETFRRALNQIGRFPGRVKVFNFSGQGEPLLNRELPEMIEYAAGSGAAERLEIITNASLLDHGLSDRLVKAGLDCIRISLQGMSAGKYKTISGWTIDFERFVDEIRYLYLHRKQCRVFVKVMDISLDEGEEEKFYWTFDGISDRMYIERCKPVYDGVEATKDLGTGTDRYGRSHRPRMVCPLPFYMLGILPDGTVSPCETIYVPRVLGNVWSDDIVDLWNGDQMRSFREMQLSRQRMGNPQCAKCCAPDDVAHPEDDLD